MRMLDIVPPCNPSSDNSIGRKSCLRVSFVTSRRQFLTYSSVGLDFFPILLAMPINEGLVVAQVSVDVDILAANLPENRLVLERILEAVIIPIVDIRVVEMDLASDDHVHMPQEGEVNWRVDPVYFVEHDGAPVVAFVE